MVEDNFDKESSEDEDNEIISMEDTSESEKSIDFQDPENRRFSRDSFSVVLGLIPIIVPFQSQYSPSSFPNI